MRKIMGYRLMFLVSQLTAELWNACMSITFSGMGYEMVNQIIVVEKGHHANIVQVVKTCYKIKINSRESKSCFYGVLVSVSAMLVYTCQKNIAQAFILERYFFVSICPAAIPGTCLSVFLAAVLPLC